MSILVTGGSGFVGSNFIIDLLAISDELVKSHVKTGCARCSLANTSNGSARTTRHPNGVQHELDYPQYLDTPQPYSEARSNALT
jgi:hypothetical protein